ncbi:hypothetical protein [Streptomyces sp. NBC_00503]|uniref:hypothetical protein n=1 Tax=Streptomyces sp. NBC_00503 TaxID=2903659 RepID=UPI002E81322B|nr:hypothetical protein [Streptomyces sp. NBC_00503]WUD85551.1 hypothetical protein OG490_36150 [Streptomyces sp. NBC_00503]
MTGVLAGHRGRGVALAMKLLAISFARSHDVHWMRALRHPDNAAAIGMNRRRGFVEADVPVRDDGSGLAAIPGRAAGQPCA